MATTLNRLCYNCYRLDPGFLFSGDRRTTEEVTTANRRLAFILRRQQQKTYWTER